MGPIQKLKTKKNGSSFLCLKEREPKNCPVLASKNVEEKKKRENVSSALIKITPFLLQFFFFSLLSDLAKCFPLP